MPGFREALLAVLSMLILGGGQSTAQSKWGILYPSIYITSDYRYDGMSMTGHKPTPQVSLYLWRPDNFYGGIWASRIDFSQLGDTTTDIEIDIYGGRHFEFGATRLTLEAKYTFFPDKKIPGPTYNFLTAKAGILRSFRRLSVASSASWVPDLSYNGGPSWRTQGEITYDWKDWLKTSANIGRLWSNRAADRTFWDFGTTVQLGGTSWSHLAFDLRYSDTNLNMTQCSFTNWCEPGLTGTLQINFWRKR